MGVLAIENVEKTYTLENVPVHALRGVSVEIQQGEYVAIMGPSGSGKSTLMNLIGCLDRPTRGRIRLDGVSVETLTDDQLAEVRNKKVGFVFQTFNLLPRNTALENVEMPLIYRGVPRKERMEKASGLMTSVGLGERMNHRPNALSGGEKQRVAIARALANNPAFLLADEPTGNLDSKSGTEIMKIFQELNSRGVTILVVTHDRFIAEHSGRILHLKDGEIVQEEIISKKVPA